MTTSQSVLPPDLAALDAAYVALQREAAELLVGHSDAALDWQPKPGKSWSVLTCLEHVTVSANEYLAVIEPAIALAAAAGEQSRREPLVLPWFGRWFVAQIAPPPKRRLPAPPKARPRLHRDRDQTLTAFVAAHQRARAALAAAAPLDVNRIRFRNPFLPLLRFTLGTGFTLLDAHGRRHLLQARNVTLAAGFPRS